MNTKRWVEWNQDVPVECLVFLDDSRPTCGLARAKARVFRLLKKMKNVLSELVFASTVAKVFGDGAAWPVQVRKSLVVLLLVVFGLDNLSQQLL